MGATRNGIFYNLKESCYRFTLEYDDKKIVFVFSSKYNKKRFLDKFVENRYILTYSLYKRFACWITADELYDIVLYSKLEKRGFLIIVNGVEHVCLENLKLDGVSKIEER